jgi:hypothetical protein
MDPIAEVASIDIIGKRKDGGADLVILTSGPLDGSENTQRLLIQKLATYLDFAGSPEFAEEFGQGVPVTIKLNLSGKPDPLIETLIAKRLVPRLTESNVRLEVVQSG